MLFCCRPLPSVSASQIALCYLQKLPAWRTWYSTIANCLSRVDWVFPFAFLFFFLVQIWEILVKIWDEAFLRFSVHKELCLDVKNAVAKWLWIYFGVLASLCISLLCSVCSVNTRMFWVQPYKKPYILCEPVAKGRQEISRCSVQRNVFEAVGALLSLPTAAAGTQPPALRATTQPAPLSSPRRCSKGFSSYLLLRLSELFLLTVFQS